MKGLKGYFRTFSNTRYLKIISCASGRVFMQMSVFVYLIYLIFSIKLA